MKKCPKCGAEYSDDLTLCPADGLALEATHDTLIGQVLAGKYRIDSRVSEGGMGKVYMGTNVPLRTTFNPMKVLIPSAAGLILVFAVIYAFTRNSQPAPPPPQGSSLVADPNSQPVEPASPATGKNEEGIPAGGAIAKPGPNANSGINPNVNLEASPSPSVIGSVGENLNTNENSNSNSNRKAPALPSSSRPVNVNEPPPPPPAPTATTQSASPTYHRRALLRPARRYKSV